MANKNSKKERPERAVKAREEKIAKQQEAKKLRKQIRRSGGK